MSKIWQAALALTGLLTACGGDSIDQPALGLGTPISLEGSLLYVASEANERSSALLLDVAAGGKTQRIELPEGTAHMLERSGNPGEAVLLTEGTAARLKDGKAYDAIPSRVLIFDRTGETKRFELSGRYAQLTLSDDGRFAIAYAPSGAWSTADSIAVIDLERESDAPVPSTTVRALDGQGPSAVAFAPADGKRRLAVLVMTDAINVIDLEHPELRDKVLPLKLPNGAAALRARKVLFAGDGCFVQSDRSNDVLAVRFEDDTSPLGFRASLSTLGTENLVQDIVLLDSSSAPRLLALGQGTLRIIDTVSGDSESSSTAGAFTAVHTFVGRSPFDSETRQRGLLYATGTNRLGFVDLQAELPGNERSVDIVTLNGSIQRLELSKQQPLAIVAQGDGKISFVDLEERTVSSLNTEGTISALIIDEREGVNRAWVLMPGSLGAVGLADRSPEQILLEQTGTYIVPVLGEKPLIAVGQGTSSGGVLLLDAKDPSRSSGREMVGFLFNRFLD